MGSAVAYAAAAIVSAHAAPQAPAPGPLRTFTPAEITDGRDNAAG